MRLAALFGSAGRQGGEGDGPVGEVEDAQKPVATAGLIPCLSSLLVHLQHQGSIRSAVLCADSVHHCRSTTYLGRGSSTWDCGYRNAQMLFSAVRSLSACSSLDLPSEIPSIMTMQKAIERAWADGYDLEGAQQFGGKLVRKRRWIGTTEVYVLFTWWGVRARIVDFPEPVNGGQSTVTRLTKWIRDYFGADATSSSTASSSKRSLNDVLPSSGGSAIQQTTKLPLYLQHQGHSRTVVGVETAKNGETWLILFDPAKSVAPTLKRAAAAGPPFISSSSAPSSVPDNKKRRGGFGNGFAFTATTNDPQRNSSQLDPAKSPKLLLPYRASLKSLGRKNKYQVLYVDLDRLALTDEEKKARKHITCLFF